MTPAVHYCVQAQPKAHVFEVTLTIDKPQAQQIVSLPVWIAGSYLVREFARHMQHLSARQGRRSVAVRQLDKCSWRIDCAADTPLRLSYEVYAFDNSVRAAWLGRERAFFNGTSLCLRVHGQEHQPHTLEVPPLPGHADWQLATGLTPVKTDKRGFGRYAAADYDELVDCPVEMGAFWSGEFKACGIPHRLVVAGAPPTFDSARLLSDTQTICETEIRFWHGKGTAAGKKAPHQRYVFMLNVVEDGYGGLEHRNSTALICSRPDLPRLGETKTSDGYTILLGLISHEYFHTWNVKRLRPAEFARYDYTQENYTELLWFFEGFTSYYDDLLLLRAGLIDEAKYLDLLVKTINGVAQAPGRQVQSVAQSSFDAWVKYYRQDENTPNATVNYYAKGSLVALCLDLSLRQEGCDLDTVMRGLWQRCKGGPMREQDLLDELQARTGRSWAKEIGAWVHSTQELPLAQLFKVHGIEVNAEPGTLAQRLGVRVTESGGVRIKTVLRHSVAEQAGLSAGDEWLGVHTNGKTPEGWRIRKLDDITALLGKPKTFTALVARDQRMLQLPVKLGAPVSVWKLKAESDRASRWPLVAD
jgi:predicted metalloprotease with PDZ domain